MVGYDLDLRTLLDIPKWEAVQDQIAMLTGTAIITIDFKGNPVTKHSCRTEFCSVIRENPISRKRCYRCDALAGLEAVRLGKPYIYLCHCGIVDVAVPIMIGERYLGAVMFGEIRLPKDSEDSQVDRLVNEVSLLQAGSGSAQQNLLELYERLPEMEYDRIVQIANLINSFLHYTIERTLSQVSAPSAEPTLLLSVPNTHIPKSATPDVSGEPDSVEEDLPVPKGSAIYPAIAYIHSHPGQSLPMNETAALCHLSPSYFSRVFHREVGESFTSYVNRQKVKIAKQMLRTTENSISTIAGELGYLNTSHFINLFKRYEGMTPYAFRQQNYR